jgi:hypothetical protein
MAGWRPLRRARTVLAVELAAVRRQDPDFDAVGLGRFGAPLLLRLLGVLALGVVPLIVIRMGDDADEMLVPLVGSLALAVVCTAVVTWLLSIVISGAVIMIIYRQRPALMSDKVVAISTESFGRVSAFTSDATLVTLVAGLLGLAVGLPTRSGDALEHSVIEDLLTAQVACLLVLLAFGFLAESIRAAADIVDDQSILLAWPWALVITTASVIVASVAGPFEITAIVARLLAEWLPAEVNGVPRVEVIAEIVPANARWLVLLAAFPVMLAVWGVQVVRHGGVEPLRRLFLDSTDDLHG